MNTSWREVPLWSITTEKRTVIDPTALGKFVFHYSIPSLDEFGAGQEESSESIRSDKLILHGGEVLISKLNPRKSRVVSVDYSSLPIIGSTEFVALDVHDAVEQRFLAYVLSSENVRLHLDSMVQSVTRSHQRVSPEDIRHVQILLPPLDEQRRIADFLDAETGRIDRIVAVRKRQIDSLKERVSAEISDTLVPGCLTRPLGMWPWLWMPELPQDRPVVRLGYLARLQSGLTVDSMRDLNQLVVTRPYLRAANVQAGYVELDSVTDITVPVPVAKRSELQPGDVLMTEGGDLDKLGRGTVWHGQLPGCLHQNHVFAVRPNPKRLDAEYLAFATRSLHGRCYFESTGVKTTNLASTTSNKILSFPVPLPSMNRQQKIARYLEKEIDAVERTQVSLDRQLELLAERRQALITAAVTGQIDVTTARGVEVP